MSLLQEALVAIDECLEGVEGAELELRVGKLRDFLAVCESDEE